MLKRTLRSRLHRIETARLITQSRVRSTWLPFGWPPTGGTKRTSGIDQGRPAFKWFPRFDWMDSGEQCAEALICDDTCGYLQLPLRAEDWTPALAATLIWLRFRLLQWDKCDGPWPTQDDIAERHARHVAEMESCDAGSGVLSGIKAEGGVQARHGRLGWMGGGPFDRTVLTGVPFQRDGTLFLALSDLAEPSADGHGRNIAVLPFDDEAQLDAFLDKWPQLRGEYGATVP